jgi:hypothetical protein
MEKFDDKLATWISKKLMVFLIATVALFIAKIDSSDWTYIAIAYITMQGIVDAKSVIENFKK